jgi:hypothetical protein
MNGRFSSRAGSLFIGAVLFLVAGCDEPFEPKGPFEEKLVVFALLSTHTDTQYVRLYTTYNPEGYDPSVHTADNQVAGASITLAGGGGLWRYNETTVPRSDKSRYTSDIHAYALLPFTPVPNTTYTLDVRLPDGKQARGTALVPGRGYLSVVTLHVLDRPESFAEDLYVLASIAPRTRGFLVRFFVEFEVTVNGRREVRRVEVPQRIRRSPDGEVRERIFPKLQRRTSFDTDRNQGSEYIGFQRDAYLSTLNDIALMYAASNPVLKNAVLVLTQVDANLYNYYNVVNGFQDEFTIRTDQPDVSSIQGGVGMFGAMTVDTVRVSYRH